MKPESKVNEAVIAGDENGGPAKRRRLPVEAPSQKHSRSNRLTRTVTAWIERLMGLPIMGGASEAIAKVGLRGLGVNLGHDFERSGERYLLDRLAPRLAAWTCFDIGANVGDYTRNLLDVGAGRVFAFEPSPDNFALLRERFFQTAGTVHVVNVAVGERTGNSSFFVALDQKESVRNSRDSTFTALPTSAFQEISVPLMSIDAYVAESGNQPDFVKIDVEGFELEVLQGMQATLQLHPPKVIQFEFNTHHLKRRHSLADFAAILPDFALYRLASRSLRELDLCHYLSNVYAYSNVIALHRDFGEL
jgi:FkbM family methyltransferase